MTNQLFGSGPYFSVLRPPEMMLEDFTHDSNLMNEIKQSLLITLPGAFACPDVA